MTDYDTIYREGYEEGVAEMKSVMEKMKEEMEKLQEEVKKLTEINKGNQTHIGELASLISNDQDELMCETQERKGGSHKYVSSLARKGRL